MNMGLFGPLATRGSTVTTSQWIHPAASWGPASVFYESWTAEGTTAGGTRIAMADYNILPPTGDKAFFHFLLDASGSTWDRTTTGGQKQVYEYLLDNFHNLVQHLRPHDQVFVWLFNKTIQLLCHVDQQDFHKQIDTIRKKYRAELDVAANWRETRLYDAVAKVMDSIRETWRKNKKADFFLVPFTDGQDNTSKISIREMCGKVAAVDTPSRLHTFFITANLPEDCELYKQLEHQSEISLIKLENTEPREIIRGFNTLRELMIKAILVVVTRQGRDDELVTMTRFVDYGATRQDVAEHMVGALASRDVEEFSRMEGWHSLRTLSWGPMN